MAEEARRIDDAGPGSEIAQLAAVPPPTDVHDAARALGLCVAEILTGAREVDSIARWITDDVHRHLQQRAAVAARSRQLDRRSRARALLRVGSVIVCRPTDGVAEATVVVHTRSHARAVAMRLEERQGRWRATAVGVL
ncbi:Rv3235 family protein [Curtobacterium sp. MCPF17_002]|uniref:Rv3235 family protein n=1 Tax=Curtobacterium sp. MCPF17_002 TaxID=2175645 RepID=UPI000DA8704E|nr:Rv3235 family protein [Curtobacterium sp. MCPF17_002]WIB76316.1 Rv3235 family protein [Curtobacterium sp. MCPF17_002]